MTNSAGLHTRHHWRRMVSDYVDGELSSSDSLEVARHLWQCAECRVLLHDLLLIVDAAQELRRRASIGIYPVQCGEISNGAQTFAFGKLATRWVC